MFLELHKSYSSWIEKKKSFCTRGHAFSPLLLPKPLFILSYHNTVQPSAQCNDHCEKNLCGIVDFAEFPAFLLHKSQAKLECPALMIRICTIQSWHHFSINIKTLLFQVPSAMSLPPKLPTSIFLQSPKSPRNHPKTKTPWIALAKTCNCGLCQPVL